MPALQKRMLRTNKRFGFYARFVRTLTNRWMARNKGTQYVPEQEQRVVRSEASNGISVDAVLLEGLRQQLLDQVHPSVAHDTCVASPGNAWSWKAFVITMALAYGRYHVREQGLTAPAGWRRAKALDNFRQRVPLFQEASTLDDPQRDRVSASDPKSFITADEEQTCSGR